MTAVDLNALIQRVHDLGDDITDLQNKQIAAANERRAVLHQLNKFLPHRDIALRLGLSKARVTQMMNEDTAGKGRAKRKAARRKLTPGGEERLSVVD